MNREAQDAIAAAAELERTREAPGAGELPQQSPEDPAAGTGLEGRGELGRKEMDVHRLARELFGLRGSGFESGNYFGMPEREVGNLDKYGAGTAAGAAGAPSSGGKDAYEARIGDTVVTKTTETAEDGSGETITTETVVHADGSSESSMEVKDAAGRTISLDVTHYDAEGNVTYDAYSRLVEGKNGSYVDHGGASVPNKRVRVGAGTDSQPNENVPDPDVDPVNPVTGWGAKRKKNPMDMITQPVHGDAVTSADRSSPTSRVGTGVVTNPDDHHEGSGGGGSRGGEPGEGAVDPEEIIPGGPVPAPGEGGR